MGELPRLAIVGASVRAAAQSAVGSGFRVVAADLFCDQDLRQTCEATRIHSYPDGLLEWLTHARADAWMYTGGLENHPELIDRMAAVRPLWGNAGSALRASRDPAILRQALSRAGLSFPETTTDPAGVPLDSSWIAKSGRGSSGSGVWSLDSQDALDRALALKAGIQQRLTPTDGVPASVVYVLDGDRSRTLGVSRQTLGGPLGPAGEFQYTGSIAPLPTTPAARRQLATLRRGLSNHLGLRGIVGVDIWLSESRVWVLEVNPRFTASVQVLERVGATGPIVAHAAAFDCSIDPPALAQPAKAPKQAASRILFARRDLRVSSGLLAKIAATVHAQADCSIADIPAAGEPIPRGAPVLTVLATDDRDTAGRVAKVVAAIEAHLYADD